MSKGQGLVAGDRIMDTLIKQKATIVRPIQSALLPEWTCMYLVLYDKAPPMEYNMGSLEGLVSPGRAVKLDEHDRTPKKKKQ